MSQKDEPFYDPDGFARLATAEEWLFWFTARKRLICWALRSHFPDLRSFGEIGFGTGATLQAVGCTFPTATLTGIDYYEEGLPWARKRVPHATLLRGDIHALPEVVRHLDVVGAFDVLEHLPDDRQALASLYAALRPGAGLILTVPQHQALWSIADEVGHHRRRYARNELIEKVQTAGFELIESTSFVSLLLPALWLSRKRLSTPNDAYREIRVSRFLNFILTGVMFVEYGLIRIGFRPPAGGSLLLLARRT